MKCLCFSCAYIPLNFAFTFCVPVQTNWCAKGHIITFPRSKFSFQFLNRKIFTFLKFKLLPENKQISLLLPLIHYTLSLYTQIIQTGAVEYWPTCCQSTPCVCDGFLFLEFWIFCLASVLWSLEGICKFKIKSLFYGPWDFLMLVQAPSMGAAKFADCLELNS